MKKTLLSLAIIASFGFVHAQKYDYNGLDAGMNSLYRLSDAKTRSISPESFTGEKGKAGMMELEKGTAKDAARDLGLGWKVNPFIDIKPDSTFVLADITGPGAIQHIWLTPAGDCRHMILRMYWDDEKEPSIEVPIGDFFASAWSEFRQISSLAICVNPGNAYNCYWPMPFRKKAKITIENINAESVRVYYQIDYTLTQVPDDAAYFHAQFRRVNPLPYKDVYTIVDDIKGKGQFVGTYMAWGVHNSGWWGEGEIKFYMDGDSKFPTICGTGTEDYFCGSYCFLVKDDATKDRKYQEYTTPYAGMPYVSKPDGVYKSQQRFSLYRWHIADPVRFDKDLKVTMQALGWREGNRYLPLQDDISSVAFWYQTEPHNKFPILPSKDYLEIH